jgi:hypothetical protein
MSRPIQQLGNTIDLIIVTPVWELQYFIAQIA